MNRRVNSIRRDVLDFSQVKSGAGSKARQNQPPSTRAGRFTSEVGNQLLFELLRDRLCKNEVCTRGCQVRIWIAFARQGD